jgi:hypothetical protein
VLWCSTAESTEHLDIHSLSLDGDEEETGSHDDDDDDGGGDELVNYEISVLI